MKVLVFLTIIVGITFLWSGCDSQEIIDPAAKNDMKAAPGITKGPLLFAVDLGFQQDLDNSFISPGLQTAFSNNGYRLSQSASVSFKQLGLEWVIDDEDEKLSYQILKDDSDLKVYSIIEGEQFMILRVYRYQYNVFTHTMTSVDFLDNSSVEVTDPGGDVIIYNLPVGELRISSPVLGVYILRAFKSAPNTDDFTQLTKEITVRREECSTCDNYYPADFYLTDIADPDLVGPGENVSTDGRVIPGRSPIDINNPDLVIPGEDVSDRVTLTRSDAPVAPINISATFIPAIGMSKLLDMEQDLGLFYLGGVELQSDELINPVTLTLDIRSGLLKPGAVVWLYSFDLLTQEWVERVETSLNAARTKSTAQIDHFSIFGWFTEKTSVTAEIYLVSQEMRFSGWLQLESADCGEAVAMSNEDLPIIRPEYLGNPFYRDVAIQEIEEKILRGEIPIYQIPKSFKIGCDAQTGNKVALSYRYLYRIYQVYGANGDTLVGQILVPERVDFLCNYSPCHDQGVGGNP